MIKKIALIFLIGILLFIPVTAILPKKEKIISFQGIQPSNIRKNDLKLYFNQQFGNIERADFNYSLIDKEGNVIKTKVIDAIEFFSIETSESVTFPSTHTFSVKLEYWINQILNKIKENEGIDVTP